MQTEEDAYLHGYTLLASGHPVMFTGHGDMTLFLHRFIQKTQRFSKRNPSAIIQSNLHFHWIQANSGALFKLVCIYLLCNIVISHFV